MGLSTVELATLAVAIQQKCYLLYGNEVSWLKKKTLCKPIPLIH